MLLVLFCDCLCGESSFVPLSCAALPPGVPIPRVVYRVDSAYSNTYFKARQAWAQNSLCRLRVQIALVRGSSSRSCHLKAQLPLLFAKLQLNFRYLHECLAATVSPTHQRRIHRFLGRITELINLLDFQHSVSAHRFHLLETPLSQLSSIRLLRLYIYR